MSSRAAPLATVVVPVWDSYVRGHLGEALASLAAQDVPARLLIVDNASTEAVPTPPEAQIIRAPRRLTVGEARNLGLEHVTTRYVVFWDADDAMLPGTLGFLLERLESRPELVAYACAIVEEPGGRRHRWPRPWVSRLIERPRLFALVDAIWSVYPTTGATMMRTEAVRSAGGYIAADSGEDWGLGVSLAFRGRVGWSERPGRMYRQHPESVWAQHMGASDQRRHARATRQRLAGDPGVSSWLRVMLPAVAVAQWTAIAAHVARAALRRRPTR